MAYHIPLSPLLAQLQKLIKFDISNQLFGEQG